MTEDMSAAQLAAQDRTDARFADVSAQIERRMRRTYNVMHEAEPGLAESKVVEFWNAALDSDIDFVRCRHPTDRYYWVIDRPILLCERCWQVYRFAVAPLMCWDHTCRLCSHHQPDGMEYHMHILVFSGEVGPDAEELPVLIIPFTLCDECEKKDNAV